MLEPKEKTATLKEIYALISVTAANNQSLSMWVNRDTSTHLENGFNAEIEGDLEEALKELEKAAKVPKPDDSLLVSRLAEMKLAQIKSPETIRDIYTDLMRNVSLGVDKDKFGWFYRDSGKIHSYFVGLAAAFEMGDREKAKTYLNGLIESLPRARREAAEVAERRKRIENWSPSVRFQPQREGADKNTGGLPDWKLPYVPIVPNYEHKATELLRKIS